MNTSQPFGKKFQKTVGGIFCDSHCKKTCIRGIAIHALYKFSYLLANGTCNYYQQRLLSLRIIIEITNVTWALGPHTSHKMVKFLFWLWYFTRTVLLLLSVFAQIYVTSQLLVSFFHTTAVCVYFEFLANGHVGDWSQHSAQLWADGERFHTWAQL